MMKYFLIFIFSYYVPPPQSPCLYYHLYLRSHCISIIIMFSFFFFHRLYIISHITHTQKKLGTIGMLGSVAIAVNSLTGPAMINLPYVYQSSGFIPTTVTLTLFCILSTLCSLHLANVISKVPGNQNFHKEVCIV